MPNRSKFFIEVDCCQRPEKGQIVSGDVYIQRRQGQRIITVLADGDGSGIKANIIGNVIASMAINYTINDEGAEHAAKAIIKTFNTDDTDPWHKHHATFTILDVNENGLVKIVEYGNPHYILLRGTEQQQIECIEVKVEVEHTDYNSLYISEFQAKSEDRIIVVSDGVSDSGLRTRRLPNGWGTEAIAEMSISLISENSDLSAHQLSRKIVGRAEINDLFSPKSDMSCNVIYFRQPRRILVCSGPPFNEKKDAILADMVANYPGSKLICGGTTSQIIARELGREVNVKLKRDPSGLPPTSTMEGVDLITEGVLTLNKVKNLLERSTGTDIAPGGTDATVARMLLEHDIIDFVVGTRINPIHQDPNLPMELELRRNLIKTLAGILESKFMKTVNIQYF